MPFCLHAVTASPEALVFPGLGLPRPGDNQPSDVEIHPCGPVGLVLSECARADFHNLSREDAAREFLTHQKALEAVADETGFLLPVQFGTLFDFAEEAVGILAPHAETIAGWIGQWRELTEIDVVATWEPEKIVPGLARSLPEIAEAFARLPAITDDEERRQLQIEAGQLLQRRLHENADARRLAIRKAFAGLVQAHAEHPLMDDRMVMNTSFLLPQSASDEFFARLEKVDEAYSGELHFRCIAPLPLYSFALIEILRFRRDDLADAAAVLGLAPDAWPRVTPGDLRHTWLAKAKAAHPDSETSAAPAEEAAFNRAKSAFALLAAFRAADLPAEGFAASRTATLHLPRLSSLAAEPES